MEVLFSALKHVNAKERDHNLRRLTGGRARSK